MARDSYLDELDAAQKEPFKYAVFSGGGAKGAIYSGVHEELNRSNILSGIEAVAGSSAGAITAAFIASGISTKDFKHLSKNTNFKKLLGDGFIINKDGKPLYELMQNTVSSNIAKYLQDNDILETCRARVDYINHELESLNKENNPELQSQIESMQLQKSKLQDVIDNNGAQITDLSQRAQTTKVIYFKDIDLMHAIDPIKFKDLVVTATNRSNGELTIFDARKSPDVEVALACRASASIPVVFEPVKINGVEYVDGGYRDNIPQKYFDKQKPAVVEDSENVADDVSDDVDQIKLAKQQGRTLALAFGSEKNDSLANIAVYSAKENICDPNMFMKFIKDVLFKFIAKVGGIFKYSEEENKTYQGLRENALNTVILDTQDVGTLSFKEAQEKSEYLHLKGLIQTGRYFENHSIGNNPDPHLEQKEFMLKVYEETQGKSFIQQWTDKIIGGKSVKLGNLLGHCKEEAWQQKNTTEVLSYFVQEASLKRSDGTQASNTATMTKLVEILNDKTTPDTIKADFIKIIGAATPQYTDKITTLNTVVDHKFKVADFDKVIAKASIKVNSHQEKLAHQKARSNQRTRTR